MPLTFDFPLEKLKTYQGINPRPADFDAFWDQRLAEMHALDPQVSLTPAEFQVPFAECFDMRFTGVGGARVYAKLLQPVNAPSPHPAVVHVSRLQRRFRRLDRQAGLRRQRVHRRRPRLPGTGRALRGRRRGHGQHPSRAHYPRPRRRAERRPGKAAL